MNFLAHLWLADRSGTSMPGAILGDVVRGADLSAYPEDVAQGIRLHRRVDAATDRHPLIVGLRAAFPSGERRFAGVVLDLAADRALAHEWPSLGGGEALEDFARRSARAVTAAGPWFVHGGGRAPTTAGFAALLMSYATDAGIERAIGRTAARLRDPEPLVEAGRRWPDALDALREGLAGLLHDLLGRMAD